MQRAQNNARPMISVQKILDIVGCGVFMVMIKFTACSSVYSTGC